MPLRRLYRAAGERECRRRPADGVSASAVEFERAFRVPLAPARGRSSARSARKHERSSSTSVALAAMFRFQNVTLSLTGPTVGLERIKREADVLRPLFV